MRKCLLACAAVAMAGFLATRASAQETVPAPTRTTIQRTTYQTSPTPRTGLLRRLGDRRDRGVVTTAEPPMTTTKTEATTPVTPATTTATTSNVRESRVGLLARLRGRLGR